jgi:hypothetical protein
VSRRGVREDFGRDRPPADKLISEIATEIVLGDRAKDYGHPKVNIQKIADGWTAYLGIPVTPHDVCQLMVILKAMRSRHGYHRDTTVDIAGYAQVDSVVSDDDEFPPDSPYTEERDEA